MIDVSDIVADSDMQAPQPYTILRSAMQYVAGGVTEDAIISIVVRGPVQQASNKELQMLPAADRVGSIRSFWCLQPVYLTRSSGPAPSVHGEVPSGTRPGTVYTLSAPPPGAVLMLYKNGLLLVPVTDYMLNGNTITLTVAVQPLDKLWAQWPATANVLSGFSDILQYENTQYRVMQVYRVPGSGYWKALATRMQAS